MADYTSTIFDNQQQKSHTRNVSQSFRDLQHSLRYALFSYTFAGTEANTETIALGSLGVPGAKVIPELSGVRDTGGGEDIDVDVKLQAVVDGSASDISGTVSLDNNRVAFTGVAGAGLTELDADDYLQLAVDDASIGAVTAGETISVEIAYISPNLQ